MHRKAVALITKRLAGAQSSSADNIVLWSDDQVLMKRVNALDLPVLRVNLKPMSQYAGKGRWHQYLRATATVLESKGKTSFNCESHSPCVLDRERFILLTDIFKKELFTEPGIVTGSLYHNYFGTIMRDMALFKTTFDTKTCINEKTKAQISAKMFLGYNDLGFDGGIKEFLDEKFSNKSKYEV